MSETQWLWLSTICFAFSTGLFMWSAWSWRNISRIWRESSQGWKQIAQESIDFNARLVKRLKSFLGQPTDPKSKDLPS